MKVIDRKEVQVRKQTRTICPNVAFFVFCFVFPLASLEAWSWPTRSFYLQTSQVAVAGKEAQAEMLGAAFGSSPAASLEIYHAPEDTLHGWGGGWEKFCLRLKVTRNSQVSPCKRDRHLCRGRAGGGVTRLCQHWGRTAVELLSRRRPSGLW